MSDGTASCVDVVLTIIHPPLGIFLKYGCPLEFWICALLTLLGYVSGIVYAIWAITETP